ncbi:helix-turn-helix domain-containing protein [Bradyrhizobium elkanii]|jgi:transcriptional regulator with XRE-family HTH domain|uniref:helix-turn-helix domain-containing protein n=1 Tax=Bradyrhizobium elkanii TaxID=29448 RepID=UPI002168B0E6|nr:helix-turn-helix transcriptional regulator [Bradyrhizobium elkanii]MCS3690922.1 transcriptional regulator with XRE-family HTH domain [Bradyrhizobium elkanii]
MRHERDIIPAHVDPIIRRLTEVRLAWNLSLNDVANRCGADLNTFKRYENGARYPSGKMLARWADVLGYELSIWPKRSA